VFLAGKSPNIRCIYTVLANPTVLTHNPWHGTSCWAICYVSVTPVPSKGLWSLQPQVHPYTFAPKNMHGLEGPCPTAHVTAHYFFNCTCYSASLFPTAHVTAHHFFQLHMLQRITFSNCTCYSASFFQLHMLQRITFSSCTCYSASRFWHPLLPSKSQGLGPESLQDSLTVKLYQVTSLQYCFLKNTGSEIWKDTAGCKNT